MTDFSLDSLTLNRHSLLGRLDHTQRLYDTKKHEVAVAKGRQAWQPDVRALLEHLQHKEHERSVGAFERLLSAFLQDVLPGPRWVSMDLYTDRGAPALDFFLRKSEGEDAPLEDALNGTGGSVTNVLSAGLRLIALIRSGRRRFLVLDEPDCWLSPDLVPKFAAVIQQMATDLGVQVLMISHHNEQLFEVMPHRLKLNRTQEGLSAEWSVLGETPHWEDEQDGIRSLYLENFMSHASTLIPLSPGVTLLTGANDIGKSSIVAALRAVFYGGKTNINDKMIRHFEDMARVTVDFGQQRALFWERRLKGKPKEMFMMTDATHGVTNPLHRSESAKDFPEWVEQETGMGLIDGLDVQLGHQQDPVFLLNKPPSQRASALAIGSESGHVQSMIALDKEDVAHARALEKKGESELEMWHRVLTTLAPLKDTQADFQALKARHEALIASQTTLERMEALAQRWTYANEKRNVLQDFLTVEPPKAPTLGQSPVMQALAHKWEQTGRRLDVLSVLHAYPAPKRPAEPASEGAQRLARTWRQAHDAYAARVVLRTHAAPVAPQEPASPYGRDVAHAWQRSLLKIEALRSLIDRPAPVVPTIADGSANERALSKAWGRSLDEQRQAALDIPGLEQAVRDHAVTVREAFPVCPLCEQPWHAAYGETLDQGGHAHGDADPQAMQTAQIPQQALPKAHTAPLVMTNNSADATNVAKEAEASVNVVVPAASSSPARVRRPFVRREI